MSTNVHQASSSVLTSSDPSIWDAIIIGGGAAGCVFANELTAAGLKVLMLEMGPHYTDHYNEFKESELAMWSRIWDNGDYQVTGDGFTGAPNLGFGVGGGTLAWSSVALRMFEQDFKMRETYGKPYGSTVEDWPVQLNELEPYYEEAERQMGVSGCRGPWDPSNRSEMPNPPHPLYKGSSVLQKGMTELGIRSTAGSVAVASRPYQQQAECLHCGFCRSGCRIDAKYQADHVLLPSAMATGRLKLITHAVVTRILQADSGHRASDVSYIDSSTGISHSANAHIIVAANNPLEIPRLFLNSANEHSPRGLGNQHDMVGRNFFSHSGTIGVGVTDQCLDTAVGFNMANLISLDYAHGRGEGKFIGGFTLVSLNGAGAGVMAVDPYANLWGSQLKQAMTTYQNSISTLAFCEGLPVADNRITVSQNRKDSWGRPMANIHYQLHDNDRAVFAEAVATNRRILAAAGARTIFTTDSSFDAHPAGTMRMGNNRRNSVTNSFGRVHGLKNVFVAGSALFVTGSSVNPTLTLQALALRTASHIIEEFSELRD
jgi:choline dehydrogenase-like flavoprotein